MQPKPVVSPVTVRAAPGNGQLGVLRCRGLTVPCALGRTGLSALKREGDGATPIGQFTILHAYYRPDRGPRPRTGVPLTALSPDGGWCDDAGDRNYNRAVRLPYPGRTERLWRDDGLYDLIVVTSHNRHPRVRGLGSAVFLHVAGPTLAPTAGCIALERADLARLFALLTRGHRLDILG